MAHNPKPLRKHRRPTRYSLHGSKAFTEELSFEAVMTDFFCKLQRSQKPHDPALENALYSNLWDLYSCTDPQ